MSSFEIFSSRSAKLANTKRLYYLQSLSLFYACRNLPAPAPENRIQLKDLERLFSKIEKALRLGTLPSDVGAATRAFNEADMALRNYLAKHHVRLQESNSQVLKGRVPVVQPGAVQEAAEKDNEAQENLIKVGNLVHEKLLVVRGIPKVKISVQFWEDCPIELRTQRDTRAGRLPQWRAKRNTHVLDITATLDMLLHRLLEHIALKDQSGKSKHRGMIHLIQHPHFYPAFLSSQATFDSIAKHYPDDQNKKIRALKPWKRVKDIKVPEGGALHLIMERKPDDDRKVQLLDGSLVQFPEEFTNAWPLEDSMDTLLVRRRSCSSSLSTWQTPTKEALVSMPEPMYPATNSSMTLVEIPSTSDHIKPHQAARDDIDRSDSTECSYSSTTNHWPEYQ